MKIQATRSVGDIVNEFEQTIPVLENMHIDYSFSGNRTLKDACYLAGVPLGKVLPLLEEVLQKPRPDTGEPDWKKAPLEDLIDHIVERHHLFTWSQLARLRNLSEKASLEQGIDHPELIELNWALKEISREIEAHMIKEEEIVFPHLRLLIKARENGGVLPREFGGFVPEGKPFQVLAWEHAMICKDCVEIHQLTNDFKPMKAASQIVKDLYRGLRELELDLHQHTHLENNVLFKRAIDAKLLD